MFRSSLQTLNFQRCPPFGVKLNTTAAGLRCCRGRLPVRIVVSGVVFTLNRIENNPQPNCSSSPWGVTQGSSYRCEKCYSKPHPRLVEKRVVEEMLWVGLVGRPAKPTKTATATTIVGYVARPMWGWRSDRTRGMEQEGVCRKPGLV